MNENTALVAIWVTIIVFILLCTGDPDILDGLIKMANK